MKGRDFFCKTATSRRENILRGVDVTVVVRFEVSLYQD